MCAVVSASLFFNCVGSSNEGDVSSNEGDISSNEVTIGKQVWMTENLNVDKFGNGDPIPHAKTKEEWKKAGENEPPAWCYYDNDTTNGEKYGKLYNWFAANDPRGLAPQGWHIPSDEEWTKLTDDLGGEQVAGGKMKSTGTQYWISPNIDATNESGFSGLPGGGRSDGGPFPNVGGAGGWWSSTEANTDDAWGRYLHCSTGNVIRNHDAKAKGFSVRCLKD